MARDGRNDLRVAADLLQSMGLHETAATVQAMRADVESATPLTWMELKTFLARLEKETLVKCPLVAPTFERMQGVMMAAFGGLPKARRGRLVKRGLEAPALDPTVRRMERTLPPIHDALQQLSGTRHHQATLLLALFGHAVRWHVLDDLVKEWVGHWGQGLSEQEQGDAIDFLLTIQSSTGPASTPGTETWLYRQSIAHGNFEVGTDGFVQFWNSDALGSTHPLPPLNAPDILNLYNLSELHLRAIELFARVMRGWARSAETPLETPVHGTTNDS